MAEKLNINQWAEEDRPREKLIAHGAETLSNAELLAIIIGSGNTDESAVELMRKILDKYQNKLGLLSKCTLQDLCQFKGIGTAKAVSILACAELGRRRREEKAEERITIRSSKDVYEFFYTSLCDLPYEESRLLFLNPAGQVIDTVRLSRGGISSTTVDIRCVLREALIRNATSIILCHNHPTGNASPSDGDDQITSALYKACGVMQIKFLDHIILCDGKYFSYADRLRPPFGL